MNLLYRLFCSIVFLSSAPLLAAADMPIGPSIAGGDPYAGAVARTVKGIVEYTRWPQHRDQLVLCVAGAAKHASQIGGWRTSGGQEVQRRNIGAQAAATARCDVLYIGTMPMPIQRQLTAAVRGKGVLTIAENDPGNSSEAMFALIYQPQSLNFRLNIDAVSRSGLKVDPRVLRVAEARY
jgi:hypothetical protein